MINRVRVKSGSVAGYAEVKGPSATELEALVRRTLDEPLAVIEREVRRVHADALATWPVKTGASRDSWYVIMTIRPEKFGAEVSLVSDDPAVRHIQSTRVGEKRLATRMRRPLQDEIRKPVGAIKRTHKAEIEAATKAAIKKVMDGV